MLPFLEGSMQTEEDTAFGINKLALPLRIWL